MRILSFYQFSEQQKQHIANLPKVSSLRVEKLISHKLYPFSDLSEEAKKKLKNHQVLAITSPKAAVWLSKYASDFQGRIYVIGARSQRELKAVQDALIINPEKNYGKSLAIEIAKHESKVLHLLGSRALTDLEEELTIQNVDYQSIEVYSTDLNPKAFELEEVDVVVFSSPSQVESFATLNQIKTPTFALCIGQTTAAAIKAHKLSFSSVQLAAKTSADALITKLNELQTQV